MGDGQLDRERAIFTKALDQPPEERPAFVRGACEGDFQLEERIHRLLAAHAHAVHAPPEGLRPSEFLDEDPQQIGPYRILERIGEGGMGVVFLAEQTSPVRRRVALKIIKLGMATKEVIARFDAERQALALMNHAGIAQIFDAGATEQGRPYFVMEYVPGIPIVEYCDSRRLGTAERLRLFVRLCEAIQHAHQKGVIHRDLKPSNILITEEEGHLVPKVIDFGIAKATNRSLSDLTLYTELGRVIGTPEYMSPEQAGTTAIDIDTRTDVYSLGVILYELLVGVRPFELSGKSFLEAQREIMVKDPKPPSARALELAEYAESAQNRGTNATALWRRLRGELDWITLRALSKDRQLRYQTALAFADDIERHLCNKPVEARPPTLAYRLSKFARRHAMAVTAVSTMVALVTALVAFYTIRLSHERDRASREADRASQEARAAEQVTEFLVGLFEVADPGEARGRTITAHEILDKGADRIRSELTEQPEAQARLMEAIGRVYLNLGLYGDAEGLIRDAVGLRQSSDGKTSADVANSLNLLGEAVYATGDYEAAEPLLRDALALRRDLLGENHPKVAESLNNVGAVLWVQGNHAEAEPYYRQALALRRALLGDNHPEVSQSLNNLAVLLHSMGDYERAETLYREVLASRKVILGPDHPETINSMNNLGAILHRTGNQEESELLLREALALRRRVLGEEHPETAESLVQLATTLQARSLFEEAEPLLRQALTLRRKQLKGNHPEVATTLSGLAGCLRRRGDCEAAEPLLQEALEILQRSLDADHWRTAAVRRDYGACLTKMGRYAEAEEQLLEGLTALREGLGDGHEETQLAASYLADLYEAWEKRKQEQASGTPSSN